MWWGLSYGLGCAVYLEICSVDTWKECAFCSCCVECFINVSLILWADGVKFCILTDFLPSCSIICWELCQIISLQLLLWIYLVLLSVMSVFVSHILQLCCLVHAHLGLLCLLDGLTPSTLWNIPPCPWQLPLVWGLFYLILSHSFLLINICMV